MCLGFLTLNFTLLSTPYESAYGLVLPRFLHEQQKERGLLGFQFLSFQRVCLIRAKRLLALNVLLPTADRDQAASSGGEVCLWLWRHKQMAPSCVSHQSAIKKKSKTILGVFVCMQTQMN